MKRETNILATISFVLVVALSGFGQDPQVQSSPALPPDVLGPQLIAWSQLQKPKPVPQPLPPPDRPTRQSDQETPGQPTNPQALPPAQQQAPANQTFTGTILKDGARYVLKTGGTSYQLDDQDDVKHYEDKQVKVVGNLDVNRNILHVVSIQLIS
ncbi:MAG: hypothetical protein LAO24_17950 [Acidobacteriia bacterium]|nr:hypothetical protein [Terriglobia bacterium]